MTAKCTALQRVHEEPMPPPGFGKRAPSHSHVSGLTVPFVFTSGFWTPSLRIASSYSLSCSFL